MTGGHALEGQNLPVKSPLRSFCNVNLMVNNSVGGNHARDVHLGAFIPRPRRHVPRRERHGGYRLLPKKLSQKILPV